MDEQIKHRFSNSLSVGSNLVEVIIEKVFNIIWAKGVIKKMP